MMPMVLYLCQHGDALAREVDPDRPLRDRGTTDVCNVANSLSGGVVIRTIVHSGKTRARQTAGLLHERTSRYARHPDWPPMTPRLVRRAAHPGRRRPDGVGPFVGRLASYLLDREREILAFEPGAGAALSRDDGGGWTLTWMLVPALVPD